MAGITPKIESLTASLFPVSVFSLNDTEAAFFLLYTLYTLKTISSLQRFLFFCFKFQVAEISRWWKLSNLLAFLASYTGTTWPWYSYCPRGNVAGRPVWKIKLAPKNHFLLSLYCAVREKSWVLSQAVLYHFPLLMPVSTAVLPGVLCSDFERVYANQPCKFPLVFLSRNSKPYALVCPLKTTCSIASFAIKSASST